MKLSVIERLTLSGLLPEKGSYTNLKLIRLAKETLSFTDKEHKLLKFRNETVGNQQKSMWNQNTLVDKTTGSPIGGSQEEVEKLISANPDKYEMRPTVGEVDIKLGEVVTHMIIKDLKSMEEKEELEDKYFSIYEKLVSRADLKLVDNQTPTET